MVQVLDIFVFILQIIAAGTPKGPGCSFITVQKGDTLASISKQYTGTANNWYQLYNQNNLKSQKLEAGQTLEIYRPAADTWEDACRFLITERYKYHNIPKDSRDAQRIVKGISEGILKLWDLGILKEEPTPEFYMDYCYATVATAEQEGLFEFRVGSAGEVSMYQFKLDTLRYSFDISGIDGKRMSDRDLVSIMLDDTAATFYFVVYFNFLVRTCYGSKSCAWRKYNAGAAVDIYTKQIVDRYVVLRNARQYNCKGEVL